MSMSQQASKPAAPSSQGSDKQNQHDTTLTPELRALYEELIDESATQTSDEHNRDAAGHGEDVQRRTNEQLSTRPVASKQSSSAVRCSDKLSRSDAVLHNATPAGFSPVLPSQPAKGIQRKHSAHAHERESRHEMRRNVLANVVRAREAASIGREAHHDIAQKEHQQRGVGPGVSNRRANGLKAGLETAEEELPGDVAGACNATESTRGTATPHLEKSEDEAAEVTPDFRATTSISKGRNAQVREDTDTREETDARYFLRTYAKLVRAREINFPDEAKEMKIALIRLARQNKRIKKLEMERKMVVMELKRALATRKALGPSTVS